MVWLKKICLFLVFGSLLGSFGCYQVHSDDADLRTVPVTNNPNILPHSGMQGVTSPKI